MIEALLFGANKQPKPVFDAGAEYGGGYYAGADIVVDGVSYLLIVSPKAYGQAELIKWKRYNNNTFGASSTNDGLSNTDAMSTGDHYSAEFCSSLTINGYDDWHMPSIDELEICFRYLKPTNNDNYAGSGGVHTGFNNGYNPNSDPAGGEYSSSIPPQTSLDLFKSGGAESFDSQFYWSSTQKDSAYAWGLYFNNALQGRVEKIATRTVRAVRWEKRI